jgi:hypothetical protein
MRSSREHLSVFFWIPAKQGFVRPCLCDEREIYCTVAVKTRDKFDGQCPNIVANARVRYDKSTASYTIFPGKQHRRLRQNCCQGKFCTRMRSKLNIWVVVLAFRNMSAYGKKEGGFLRTHILWHRPWRWKVRCVNCSGDQMEIAARNGRPTHFRSNRLL